MTSVPLHTKHADRYRPKFIQYSTSHPSMSRHLTNCPCTWCQPPEAIRRLFGKVFGYPQCCIDAFEDESDNYSAKDDVRDELTDLKTTAVSGLKSLGVFMPCRKCAGPMLKACKTYKRRGKRGFVKAFKKFMTRPFSYDYMPEGPHDDTFKKAAVQKLTSAEYEELYDYFEENMFESEYEDSSESESEPESEPSKDIFSCCWVTLPSGARIKHYHKLPKHCIPCP